jgi:hypothetical protein
MKSEIAKNMLAMCPTPNGMPLYITRSGAEGAVELAEQDARDRAVDAFSNFCNWRVSRTSKCRITDNHDECAITNCERKKLFLKHYDEDEQ